jgi:hypothetical protein
MTGPGAAGIRASKRGDSGLAAGKNAAGSGEKARSDDRDSFAVREREWLRATISMARVNSRNVAEARVAVLTAWAALRGFTLWTPDMAREVKREMAA